MRIMMLVSSAVSYFINEAVAKARYGNSDHMNFEAPLTSLVWLTSIVSIILTFVVSKLMIPDLGGDATLWWKLASIISCGTLAGAIIPELVKVFTLMSSSHVKRNRDVLGRRRPVAQHSLRLGGRQLLRLLAGPQHGHPDGRGVLRQHHGTGRIPS